jgi:hypothetical protein
MWNQALRRFLLTPFDPVSFTLLRFSFQQKGGGTHTHTQREKERRRRRKIYLYRENIYYIGSCFFCRSFRSCAVSCRVFLITSRGRARWGKGRSIEQQLIRWIGESTSHSSDVFYSSSDEWHRVNSENQQASLSLSLSLLCLFFDSLSLPLLSVCRLVPDKSPAAARHAYRVKARRCEAHCKCRRTLSKSIDLQST